MQHASARVHAVQMATEKAPVAVTGGAGFEFHDRVAARCLLDLLLGRAFAAHLGAVVKIKWEVRESGQFGDDLVLSCRRDGVETRSRAFPEE